MPMEYADASDVKRLLEDIVDNLGMFHVVPQFVYCIRSKGSESKHIIARIHGLGRIWQEALQRSPSYIIEVISEQYDQLTEANKEKTIIHELLHIPKGFAGGLRPHKGYVDRQIVEDLYSKLQRQRQMAKYI